REGRECQAFRKNRAPRPGPPRSPPHCIPRHYFTSVPLTAHWKIRATGAETAAALPGPTAKRALERARLRGAEQVRGGVDRWGRSAPLGRQRCAIRTATDGAHRLLTQRTVADTPPLQDARFTRMYHRPSELAHGRGRGHAVRARPPGGPRMPSGARSIPAMLPASNERIRSDRD